MTIETADVVVVIDCITLLFLEPSADPINFLGSLLAQHRKKVTYGVLIFSAYTVILSHHVDVPLSFQFPHYPSAQTLLSHISTTLLRVSSVGHHRLKMDAESRALPDPVEYDFAKAGVVSALHSNPPGSMIVELENRKKSGRSTVQRCIFDFRSGIFTPLDPLIPTTPSDEPIDFGTTFNLGISEHQRQSKDGVVLPHFAAQRSQLLQEGASAAEIEYILDTGDDFDDEEDVDEDLLI
jgi:elongator complex protein 5